MRPFNKLNRENSDSERLESQKTVTDVAREDLEETLKVDFDKLYNESTSKLSEKFGPEILERDMLIKYNSGDDERYCELELTKSWMSIYCQEWEYVQKLNMFQSGDHWITASSKFTGSSLKEQKEVNPSEFASWINFFVENADRCEVHPKWLSGIA